MKKLWLRSCALLLTLHMAGCTVADEKAIPVKDAFPTAAVPLLSNITTKAPGAAPSPVPKDTPALEQTAVALYRMNDVYRFVPILESSPAKAVLLTFDDGPKDEAVINSLLDTLDKHEAKAIFFVNGYRVKENPELLKLIHEKGHTIGNHSDDHINLKNESSEAVEKQLGEVQDKVERLIGKRPTFFRPPYGAGNEIVKTTAKNHGMLYMTWSNGSLDWDSSAKNKPEVVIKNVMEQLHPGANILMHELKWTAQGLDELLTLIEGEGYTFIRPETIQIMN